MSAPVGTRGDLEHLVFLDGGHGLVVGDVTRFPTAGAFAVFNGTAPIAASSGDNVRYRLNRGGHRD